MNFNQLFDLRGLNYWMLASALGLNAVWTLLIFIISLQFLLAGGSNVGTVQLIVLAGLFLGHFMVAWLVGRWSADLRGPSYGLIGSISSVIIALIVFVPGGGTFGLLAAAVALAGGFNGGLLSLPRVPRD